MTIPEQPLRLSGEQMNALLAASYPLPTNRRGPFLAACARELARLPMIGDGDVQRVVMAVQKRYFDPPQFGTDGGGKYNGKFNRVLRARAG